MYCALSGGEPFHFGLVVKKGEGMFNHILVPLDRSALAEEALPYALRIVNHEGRITLLSVVNASDDPNYVGMVEPVITPLMPKPGSPQQSLWSQTENYLKQVASKFQKAHLEIAVSVLEGSPADTIVDVAKGLGVQMIVMSTHGRSGLSRWIYGSVTQKVLSAAPCPVLVVPSRVLVREPEA